MKNKLALANKNKIPNKQPLALAKGENNNITEMSKALYLLRI